MVRKLNATEPTGDARRLSNACCAAVAGAAMMACFAGPAFAEASAVDPPQPERVWGGCALGDDTVALIQRDVNVGIGLSSASNIQVAFVVVYSLDNDNDGQGPVTVASTTGFTGPILCTSADVGLKKVKEADDIPAQTGPSGADSIDIRDLEEAMVLRYEINAATSIDGVIEKRFCHTTGNNNDCFRISPLIDPLP